jgi:hypothetical protein
MVVWSGSGSGDSSGIFSQRYAINGTSGEGDFVSDVYADEGNPTGPTVTATASVSLVSTATVPVPVVGFAGAEQEFSVTVARHLNPATPTSLRGPDFIDGVFLAGFLTEAGRQAPFGGTRHEVAPASWEMSASLVNSRESGTPADESGHMGSTLDGRAVAWGRAYDLVFAEVSWEEDALADPLAAPSKAAPRPDARETDQEAPGDHRGKEVPGDSNDQHQAHIPATTNPSAEAESVPAEAEAFSLALDDAPDEPES